MQPAEDHALNQGKRADWAPHQLSRIVALRVFEAVPRLLYGNLYNDIAGELFHLSNVRLESCITPLRIIQAPEALFFFK
jgi:hypothetical protein